MYHLEIDPGQLSLAQLRRIAREPVRLSLAEGAYPAIKAAAHTVAQVITEGRTVYGINTGFGLLANTRIEKHDLETLQRAIVLSHAAGTGNFMHEAAVRLLMVLKINSLARGFPGCAHW